jgi:chemotaxis protein CheZ
MTQNNGNQVSISKSDFMESFVQLYHAIREFDELIRLVSDDRHFDAHKIKDMIQNRLNYMEFGSVNVKAMEIIGAYLRFTLEKFKGDTLKFIIPEHPSDDFFSLNDGYLALSKSIEAVERDLKEIEEKVYYLSRLLPPNNIEKIGLLLKAISSFFKAIIRKDTLDMEGHINHIHHLTASKESYFVINDIGRVVREIYNSLKDFSAHVPVEDLDPSLVDDMPDAIDKLNLVIRRMENSANATLDDSEALLEKNARKKEVNTALLEKSTQMKQQLETLKAGHPAAIPEIDGIIETLETSFVSQLKRHAEELQAEEAICFNIISNQSFQDLTGQTIKKIISFIEQLEFSLLSILQKYGGKPAEMTKPAVVDKVSPLIGMATDDGLVLEGPQDNQHVRKEAKQVDVDKMLAEFGF